jgi:hypothetical protein
MISPMPSLLAIVLPLLVAFGWTGLFRRQARRRGTPPPMRAGAGPGLGFLAGFVAVAGGFPFLGSVSDHRVGEVALLSLLGGAILARLNPTPRQSGLAAAAAGLFALVWTVGGAALDDLSNRGLLLGLAAALLFVLIMRRLAALSADGGLPVVVIAIAATGLAFVAAAARAGLAQDLSVALAASCVGALLWARPFAKAETGPAALIAGGATLLSLSVAVTGTALHPPWALILLPACFWGDRIAQFLPILSRQVRLKAKRRRAVAIGAAIPAVAAGLLAALLAGRV